MAIASSSRTKPTGPSEEERERRRHVGVLDERVTNVANMEYPGIYPGEENTWDLDKFESNLRIETKTLTQSTIEFDLIGVDASIANALRRVLIAEVPTIAIENVYIYCNTSILQDEVLAHRLGLIPLKVDPRKLDMKRRVTGGEGWSGMEGLGADNDVTDRNTLAFTIGVECSRNPTSSRFETDPSRLYINSSVYSGHIIYKHEGEQYKTFNLPAPENAPEEAKRSHQPLGEDGSWGEQPRVNDEDILLVKLRPGQKIEALLYAVKGVGSDHAKFSPVATASYRLLPHIKILSPIPPEQHQKFMKCFPPGVIEVKSDPTTGEDQVVVKEARNDTVSREVLRHEEFKDKVELSRIRDHFIFSIESTGAYPPEELLPEAIDLMISKISSVEACMRARFSSLIPAKEDPLNVLASAAAGVEGGKKRGGRKGKKA